MNLNVVRAVDKWMGIPACFLLSLAHRFFLFVKRHRRHNQDQSDELEKILFIGLSEMGSVILAYPSMEYIQGEYPEAKLFFLVFEQNRHAVDILGIIPPAQVITISVRSPFHFAWSTYKAVRRMRSGGIDTVFDLELFSRFSSLLSGVSGARRRVGYGTYHEEGLYRGGFMTHRVFYNCHQHMTKNFLALVKAIERGGEYPLVKTTIAEDQLIRPRHDTSEKDLRALRERLAAINPATRDARHLVLFNPGAGKLLPIRAWPLENYGVLGEKILKEFDAVIVIIGLEDAKDEAERILERVGTSRCIDFTGRTSFKDLMDLFNLADVLVTADSGPPHFSALTDIRTIVLFGPETPVLYAPLSPHATSLFAGFTCSPCLSAYNHRKTTCQDPKCMEAITVEQVFGTISEYLNGTKRN
jgi:ADP-heptose:LPS heptosyltransferase